MIQNNPVLLYFFSIEKIKTKNKFIILINSDIIDFFFNLKNNKDNFKWNEFFSDFKLIKKQMINQKLYSKIQKSNQNLYKYFINYERLNFLTFDLKKAKIDFNLVPYNFSKKLDFRNFFQTYKKDDIILKKETIYILENPLYYLDINSNSPIELILDLMLKTKSEFLEIIRYLDLDFHQNYIFNSFQIDKINISTIKNNLKLKFKLENDDENEPLLFFYPVKIFDNEYNNFNEEYYDLKYIKIFNKNKLKSNLKYTVNKWFIKNIIEFIYPIKEIYNIIDVTNFKLKLYYDNVFTNLNTKKEIYLINQLLSDSSKYINFNNQPLEVYGDTFIKFIVVYLLFLIEKESNFDYFDKAIFVKNKNLIISNNNFDKTLNNNIKTFIISFFRKKNYLSENEFDKIIKSNLLESIFGFLMLYSNSLNKTIKYLSYNLNIFNNKITDYYKIKSSRKNFKFNFNFIQSNTLKIKEMNLSHKKIFLKHKIWKFSEIYNINNICFIDFNLEINNNDLKKYSNIIINKNYDIVKLLKIKNENVLNSMNILGDSVYEYMVLSLIQNVSFYLKIDLNKTQINFIKTYLVSKFTKAKLLLFSGVFYFFFDLDPKMVTDIKSYFKDDIIFYIKKNNKKKSKEEKKERIRIGEYIKQLSYKMNIFMADFFIFDFNIFKEFMINKLMYLVFFFVINNTKKIKIN